MLYVQLDTNWPDHPKIIDAGIEGAGLHAIALCLAKRLESDGWISRRQLYRQGATDELIAHLVSLRLLEDDGDRVRPHGWHDRNPSQAAIVARRASKSDAGKRGNHTRHNHHGAFEKCGICNPESQVLAPSEPEGSQPVAVDEMCDRIPTKQSQSKSVGSGTARPSHALELRAASHALQNGGAA